ncbi:23S rRNA (guanosine(2251)-2'-O)-methyltransferase RlmB [Chitinimonas sp. BJB300]|uniref:23S rRNA (guanosine(2251)-2'-O)-methyltransferase RlmB n=1 Tax=Chitinimonas sp. BJB300 TaxID=1559339 RepID=UPI000C0F5A95|nr:23S rRNA (guanosine(2251)-2'-O)-methyltransferase RlmB [Chitinimonas sp. BJB300]PHV13340.1 23S rRNA (guanosine(2251)-2'-O)-methyltransferase RlmB [Chitinimonas sp. BJB300]TSJ85257.1 23S rRNA (guanosine(2251)-2'-O)-methyltransferase RlmB [Chitinimonas sp. BJB300]
MSNTRVLHGFHAVTARLTRLPDSVLELYVTRERNDPRMAELLKLAQQTGTRLIPADASRLDGLTGHRRHQGVAAVIDANKTFVALEDVLEDITEPPLILILDGITDPHNLGACLRVADAMGVHAVVAPKDKSVGINATVSKVACGAAEIVPYIVVTNLARTLREIKDAGIWVAGTDMDTQTDLYHFDQTGPLAWVMGAEGEGMRRLTREHCDVLVSIPMFGTVESLNVSVASGMCLSESRRQRVVKGEAKR